MVVPLLEMSPLACSSYCPSPSYQALFTQLNDYLENNNLLHPNHHGGRKYHNTTTALIQPNDEWLAAAEDSMMTGVMMTDLSACFDLWDHGIGLEMAQLLGLEPTSAPGSPATSLVKAKAAAWTGTSAPPQASRLLRVTGKCRSAVPFPDGQQ